MEFCRTIEDYLTQSNELSRQTGKIKIEELSGTKYIVLLRKNKPMFWLNKKGSIFD